MLQKRNKMPKYILLLVALSCAVFGFTAVAGKDDAPNANTILLTPANTVNFRGVVEAGSTTRAIGELVRLDRARGKKNYPIYLVLDSPGGNIYDGLNFIQFLGSLKNVHTISLFAASMASAIVEGNPGTRYATTNSVLMFHRAKGGFSGQFEDGEVESQLRLWKAIVRGMETVNANRMGLSLESYKDKVKDEYWLFGDENMSANSVDAIVKLKCSDELIDARETATQEGLFVTLHVKYSGCPLLRDPLEIEKE